VAFAITYFSAYWTHFSISIGEIMTKTYLYPPAWPVRAMMAFGFFLFISQGVAKLIRDIYTLKGIEPKGYDTQ
jgi:TRAP-type mannitol/chloroaromatic compound transport system permease small subunit